MLAVANILYLPPYFVELFPSRNSAKKRKASKDRSHLPFKRKKNLNTSSKPNSKSNDGTKKVSRKINRQDSKGQKKGTVKKRGQKFSQKSKRPQGKRKR